MEKIFDIAKDSEKSWGVIAQGIDGNFEEIEQKINDNVIYTFDQLGAFETNSLVFKHQAKGEPSLLALSLEPSQKCVVSANISSLNKINVLARNAKTQKFIQVGTLSEQNSSVVIKRVDLVLDAIRLVNYSSNVEEDILVTFVKETVINKRVDTLINNQLASNLNNSSTLDDAEITIKYNTIPDNINIINIHINKGQKITVQSLIEDLNKVSVLGRNVETGNFITIGILSADNQYVESNRLDLEFDAIKLSSVSTNTESDVDVVFKKQNVVNEKLIEISNKIEEINHKIYARILYPDWEDKGLYYRLTNGFLEDVGNSGFVRMKVPVYQGCICHINTNTGGTSLARNYGFVDAEDILLDGTLSPIGNAVNVDIVAPEDSAYLIINSNKSYVEREISVSFPVGNKVSNHEERLQKIEQRTSENKGSYQFGIGIDCKFSSSTIVGKKIGTCEEAYGLYDVLVDEYSPYVTKVNCDDIMQGVGVSKPEYLNNYNIYAYRFKPTYTKKYSTEHDVYGRLLKVFIVTGTHPEVMGIYDCAEMMREICQNWAAEENLSSLRNDVEFYIMPIGNPWGMENHAPGFSPRTNYNGVDLNRNLPTKTWISTGTLNYDYSGDEPASEYETKMLMHLLSIEKPHIFIDHHNFQAGIGKTHLGYVLTKNNLGMDIASEHFVDMTRRLKNKYTNIFPSAASTPNEIYGYCEEMQGVGQRMEYACEQGIMGFCYETSEGPSFDNGQPITEVSKLHKFDDVSCTIAVDMFTNFILRVLKTYSDKIVPFEDYKM